MLRSLWRRFVTRLFRQQNKRIDKLQHSVDDARKQLAKQQQMLEQQQEMLRQQQRERKRRDLWPIKAAEAEYLANGRKIWVIKCPAPDNKDKVLWGEYNFALALQKELTKLGIYAVVQWHEDWYSDLEPDVVVVLRGGYRYRPDRRNTKCKYIMWLSCFSQNVTKEEYESYDLVLVASRPYAKQLQKELTVEVKPLLLCVDTERFYPQEEETKYDKVFVGNTRYEKRICIDWCERNEIPIKLWGRTEGRAGWKVFIKPESCIELMGGMRNEELPALYRQSKIILNDHFEDMREKGFLNNRVLEGLCCGRPVVSDGCSEYEDLMGDCVVYYHDEQEFIRCLEKLDSEENYEQQRQKVVEAWPKLKKEFSFEARTKELVKLVEHVINEK